MSCPPPPPPPQHIACVNTTTHHPPPVGHPQLAYLSLYFFFPHPMPPRPPRPPRLFILRPGSAYHVRHCGPMGGHHLPIGRLGRLWSSRMACAGRPPRVTHHGDAVAPPRQRYARGRPTPPSPPSTPTPLSPPQPGGSYCTTQGGWCPASCGSQTSLAGSGRTSTEAAAAQTVWGAVLDLVDGSPSRWGPARVCVASALR